MDHEESKKNKYDENESSFEESGFVVPEPDGVKSGYPIDDDNSYIDDDKSFSAEDFNNRMRQKISKINNSNLDSDIKGYNSYKNGLTIKSKLLLSLAGLTFIIIVIGLISYSSIRNVNYISSGVAENYSKLAQITEQIRYTVYQVRDAEKEFLLVEEQESLDRASRYVERLRIQINDAKDIGKKIELQDGKKIGGQYEKLFVSLDSYDTMFAQQVKNVKNARSNINENKKNVIDLKKRLLNESNRNYELMKSLNESFWLDIKKKIKQKQMDAEFKALQIGDLMNQLEIQLLKIQIQVAIYINSEKQAGSEIAREYIKSASLLANQIYQTTNDERILKSIEDVRQNLNTYLSIFSEIIVDVNQSVQRQQEIDLRINEQKKGLKVEGDNLINIANDLSNENWDNIDFQTNILSKISKKSQSFIIVIVIIGACIGFFVLIYIPKPILSSIHQLLAAAQIVSSGNLTVPIKVNSKDELGQLGIAFEKMRTNLVSLVDRIKRASVQISTSVNEIQAASNQQSSTSNEQASAVNEFNATLTEIARTSSNLAKITNRVSENAVKISEWVSTSNNKSIQILESMDTISNSTRQTSDKIKALNDQMDNINDAVITISSIADQTTLLSLNAAIEANKAGEMGKGFAVVSSEIRRLSDRSIDSASRITGMVRDIQRATENSVVAMDKSSEEIRIGIEYVKESTKNLSEINNAMEQIQDQINEITTSTKDQADSARQSQQTSSELLTSSRMVAQASKQTSTAAFELNVMANQLSDAVATFMV